ncbi:branched-chain amino acid ABC transporter ATP-binding protein [Marinobacterium zhoushanense]|uniref:Branched-chain amino acid ABC transporter ATP-binding protein n=1 Tax=Marinobacterium zhoushanense TaxID=1679163 RepID=A0ABQ1KVW5_9GAMM|nr:ABC transporter ATP-binding protein [Marinobacterium zhoushanense]GGC12173.1 branched-chain amino acid ABC transporter ATP-binding protein [Marinobacterium zhoushanense]
MTLSVEELTVCQNGKAIVKQVSLQVEPGKVTALLGANGAGKSELVLAIAGMMTVETGSISVAGQPITNASPEQVRRHGVAAVPEGHRVLASLSVDENLRAAGALLKQTELVETLKQIYELFPELALCKQQIAGTMSGGQQQMLAIGHALMAKPQYLLIDEMSLGLAPLIVKRLVKTLEQLVKLRTGVLLVEQFTEVALSIADSVIVLRSGKVCYSGSAEQLREDPEILAGAYL